MVLVLLVLELLSVDDPNQLVDVHAAIWMLLQNQGPTHCATAPPLREHACPCLSDSAVCVHLFVCVRVCAWRRGKGEEDECVGEGEGRGKGRDREGGRGMEEMNRLEKLRGKEPGR